MKPCASAIFALLGLFGAAGLQAQTVASSEPSVTVGSPAPGNQGPNTILLGTSTQVTYDSNALSSHPPIADVQYAVSQLIGINLSRPRWDLVANLAPGFSYSANLPQYQAVSLTSGVGLKYRASQRLTISLLNRFVSSANPFDSLPGGAPTGSGAGAPAATAALNYLPQTNESAEGELVYSLSPRTALTALAAYNYISYQHNSATSEVTSPFEQSNSEQLSVGLRRSLNRRCVTSLQYVATNVDSGQGQITTLGQAIEYGLEFAPKSAIRVSAMLGPEYVQTSYGGLLGNSSVAGIVSQRSAGWSWTGATALSWTKGKSIFTVNAARLLSMGTQYQGNVWQTLISADVHRRLGVSYDLYLFGSYNINKPVSIGQSVARFSNDYASTGATIGKTFAERWVASLAYWYLSQNGPAGVGEVYLGSHNRLTVSLSYSVIRSLRK